MLVDEETHVVAPYENASSLRPERKFRSKETVFSFSFLKILIFNNFLACV